MPPSWLVALTFEYRVNCMNNFSKTPNFVAFMAADYYMVKDMSLDSSL